MGKYRLYRFIYRLSLIIAVCHYSTCGRVSCVLLLIYERDANMTKKSLGVDYQSFIKYTFMSTTHVNPLFLKTLLLAEITRLQWGKGISLTNPKIEQNARITFAAQMGFNKKAKPTVFISYIKAVYYDNKLQASFDETLTRFKLNPADFVIG